MAPKSSVSKSVPAGPAGSAAPAFDPEPFLPVKKDAFHILVALADGEHHGYSIMREVAARTDGKVRLSPSGLYGAIKRLLEDGLIEELAERPDPEHDDERRRYYRLTREGRAVAVAEARRLEALLAYVKASGVLRERS